MINLTALILLNANLSLNLEVIGIFWTMLNIRLMFMAKMEMQLLLIQKAQKGKCLD
jgi:hypothetical protein